MYDTHLFGWFFKFLLFLLLLLLLPAFLLGALAIADIMTEHCFKMVMVMVMMMMMMMMMIMMMMMMVMIDMWVMWVI